MEKFKTINNDSEAEIVEKKSKFIANLYYVNSVEQVNEKLKDIKKKFYDARHNCYAYRVFEKDTVIERASDDGEPSGTAGAPMLNILKKQELINVLIIVTRYFGGILLGTGGLVKAYSEATKKSIEQSKIAIEELGIVAEMKLKYNDFENFKYCCKKNNINIISTEYLDNVTCKFESTNEEKEKLLRDLEKNEIKIVDFAILKNKNIRKNIEI